MDNEEPTYRSPVITELDRGASTRDENDYSTLIEVHRDFEAALLDLYRNFNAFELSKDVQKLEVQVAGRQVAYDLLEPLVQKLQSAINDVRTKHER